jgi:hypothetical protein
MRKYLALLLFFGPTVALAGPWCIITDGNEQNPKCSFESANECFEFAQAKGGFCQPNYREYGNKGTAPLCVVTSTMRNCRYYSRRSCLSAARRYEGGCVENTERALELSTVRGGSLQGLIGDDLSDAGAGRGNP